MPAHLKPPERRQGHRRHGPVAVVAASPPAEPPEPPARLLAATLEDWEAFWSSPLAGLVVDADVPGLRRLFTLRDEQTRALRGYKRRRLTDGSQGQLVANPLFGVAMSLGAEVRQLEDRYGLTPAARLRLGIRLGEAARSLESLVGDLDEDAEARRRRRPRAVDPDPRQA